MEQINGWEGASHSVPTVTPRAGLEKDRVTQGFQAEDVFCALHLYIYIYFLFILFSIKG